MAETVKVRTTMRPHEEIEVTPAELTDLYRQGLLELNATQRKALGLEQAPAPKEGK